ncbi:cell envelope integrity protein TolA [Limoniibacter endophyticus]|uniref:TonB C-terminal domain-containing protein n=1 Tax=Limoniibacter endophyticus TaxID=1565040 RepID=A0A8J3DNI0_9HYPH|nr:energy transducer TonB [Limoniibacter endophyticus]GHC67971.1 hypothetical protein GCM10010136_12590 [Limoniibacter endophyticus]
MSGNTDSSHAQLRRSHRVRNTILWTVAAVLVVVAHAGAAYYGLLNRSQEPLDAPQAVIIDLEPVDASEIDIAQQDTADEAMSAPEEPQPVEEPTPAPPEEVVEPESEPEPEQVEPEPQPQPEPEEVQEPEPEPEPVEEVNQDLAMLRDAEVPLPVARPEPPRERPRPVERRQAVREEVKRQETRKPVEHKQERPRQVDERPRTVRQAEQGQNQNARQQRASRANQVSPRRYYGRLVSHLRKFKKSAGNARGETMVRFSIDANGRVLSASVGRSSGSPTLDQAALATVRNASPVPAPPEGVSRSFNVPIDFRRGR